MRAATSIRSPCSVTHGFGRPRLRRTSPASAQRPARERPRVDQRRSHSTSAAIRLAVARWRSGFAITSSRACAAIFASLPLFRSSSRHVQLAAAVSDVRAAPPSRTLTRCAGRASTRTTGRDTRSCLGDCQGVFDRLRRALRHAEIRGAVVIMQPIETHRNARTRYVNETQSTMGAGSHNPKVAGSNPAPAIRSVPLARGASFRCGAWWGESPG